MFIKLNQETRPSSKVAIPFLYIIRIGQSRSTNGVGGGFDDPVPEDVTKTAPLGDGTYLHDRQACPEPNSFCEGIGRVCPRENAFLCRSP